MYKKVATDLFFFTSNCSGELQDETKSMGCRMKKKVMPATIMRSRAACVDGTPTSTHSWGNYGGDRWDHCGSPESTSAQHLHNLLRGGTVRYGIDIHDRCCHWWRRYKFVSCHIHINTARHRSKALQDSGGWARHDSWAAWAHHTWAGLWRQWQPHQSPGISGGKEGRQQGQSLPGQPLPEVALSWPRVLACPELPGLLNSQLHLVPHVQHVSLPSPSLWLLL